MVDERVGLCGACESACESEPSKRFRVLRHHPARMSWHWPLCELLGGTSLAFAQQSELHCTTSLCRCY